MKDVNEQGQTITFCGVNAHFQSGIAKRRIRELQDGARTSLIHAKHRWGSAIDSQLWPYALRHRNDVFNSTQKDQHKLSPLEVFSNSKVRPKLKHFHPLRCPAYRVNNENVPREHQHYVPKGKRHRWIVGGLFAWIGKLIDKGADFLLTIKWIRGTERSKWYRAVQAIARRISKGSRDRDGVARRTKAQR
jgi:hypothetical protein